MSTNHAPIFRSVNRRHISCDCAIGNIIGPFVLNWRIPSDKTLTLTLTITLIITLKPNPKWIKGILSGVDFVRGDFDWGDSVQRDFFPGTYVMPEQRMPKLMFNIWNVIYYFGSQPLSLLPNPPGAHRTVLIEVEADRYPIPQCPAAYTTTKNALPFVTLHKPNVTYIVFVCDKQLLCFVSMCSIVFCFYVFYCVMFLCVLLCYVSMCSIVFYFYVFYFNSALWLSDMF